MIDKLLDRFFGFDERFIQHRYKSTRAAVIVASLMMALWTWVDFFLHDVVRWDLLMIMLAMAVVKVSVMLYYRLTN
jgi:hypothetical protein